MCDKCQGKCFDPDLHVLKSDLVEMKAERDAWFEKYDALREGKIVEDWLELFADIQEDNNTVTVTAFDPNTMAYRGAHIITSAVPDLEDDGFSYRGDRDGNKFTLVGKPNSTYPQAFKIYYVLK